MSEEKELTQQEIAARYEALPEDVRAAIYSTPTRTKLAEIAKKHLLHIDQVGALDEEIGAVMLGIAPREKLLDAIANRLRLDRTKAQSVVADIDDQIFQPIRESLKKISSQGKIGTELQPVTKPQSTPQQQENLHVAPVEKIPGTTGSIQKPLTPPPPRQALAEAIAKLQPKMNAPSQPERATPVSPPPTTPKPILPTPPTQTPSRPANPPINIAATRLAGMMSSPLQEKIVKSPEAKPEPKPIDPNKPKVDPYREPTN